MSQLYPTLLNEVEEQANQPLVSVQDYNPSFMFIPSTIKKNTSNGMPIFSEKIAFEKKLITSLVENSKKIVEIYSNSFPEKMEDFRIWNLHLEQNSDFITWNTAVRIFFQRGGVPLKYHNGHSGIQLFYSILTDIYHSKINDEPTAMDEFTQVLYEWEGKPIPADKHHEKITAISNYFCDSGILAIMQFIRKSFEQLFIKLTTNSWDIIPLIQLVCERANSNFQADFIPYSTIDGSSAIPLSNTIQYSNSVIQSLMKKGKELVQSVKTIIEEYPEFNSNHLSGLYDFEEWLEILKVYENTGVTEQDLHNLFNAKSYKKIPQGNQFFSEWILLLVQILEFLDRQRTFFENKIQNHIPDLFESMFGAISSRGETLVHLNRKYKLVLTRMVLMIRLSKDFCQKMNSMLDKVKTASIKALTPNINELIFKFEMACPKISTMENKISNSIVAMSMESMEQDEIQNNEEDMNVEEAIEMLHKSLNF